MSSLENIDVDEIINKNVEVENELDSKKEELERLRIESEKKFWLKLNIW